MQITSQKLGTLNFCFVFLDYDELLISSKKHKIFLGGVDILLVDCENCGLAKYNPCDDYCCKSTYMKNGISKPETPYLTLFAEGVQWSVRVTNDEDEIIGIDLIAEKQNVRADIQMTLLTNDPAFPNINVEKKKESYGSQFFKLIPRDELQEKEGAYVRRGGYFVVEITFQSTSVSQPTQPGSAC